MGGSRVPDFKISKLPLGLFQLILNSFAIFEEINQHHQFLQPSEFRIKLILKIAFFKHFEV